MLNRFRHRPRRLPTLFHVAASVHLRQQPIRASSVFPVELLSFRLRGHGGNVSIDFSQLRAHYHVFSRCLRSRDHQRAERPIAPRCICREGLASVCWFASLLCRATQQRPGTGRTQPQYQSRHRPYSNRSCSTCNRDRTSGWACTYHTTRDNCSADPVVRGRCAPPTQPFRTCT